MHIPLRHRNRAVSHELHYSERIRTSLSEPGSKRVAKRMGNKLLRQGQQIADFPLLFVEPRLAEAGPILPVEYQPLDT